MSSNLAVQSAPAATPTYLDELAHFDAKPEAKKSIERYVELYTPAKTWCAAIGKLILKVVNFFLGFICCSRFDAALRAIRGATTGDMTTKEAKEKLQNLLTLRKEELKSETDKPAANPVEQDAKPDVTTPSSPQLSNEISTLQEPLSAEAIKQLRLEEADLDLLKKLNEIEGFNANDFFMTAATKRLNRIIQPDVNNIKDLFSKKARNELVSALNQQFRNIFTISYADIEGFAVINGDQTDLEGSPIMKPQANGVYAFLQSILAVLTQVTNLLPTWNPPSPPKEKKTLQFKDKEEFQQLCTASANLVLKTALPAQIIRTIINVCQTEPKERAKLYEELIRAIPQEYYTHSDADIQRDIEELSKEWSDMLADF